MSVEVGMPGGTFGTLNVNNGHQNGNGGSVSVDDESFAQSERLLAPQVKVDIAKRAEFQKDRSTRFSESSDRITYSWNNITAWTGKVKPIGNDRSKNNENGKSKSKFSICKSENKSILNNVSGTVRPGEFVAILGASGAGKSTLLDILSFRNSSKMNVSGTRVINGANAERNTITAFSAYVQQIDLFFGILTVREHLIFQAMVRMHKRIPHASRMERVKEVIQEFGLEDCADSRIGTKWLKGISGGEMKRLSLATEVLTDPMLMFCDEPTSGLDSSTAQNVISILKNLAATGKTMICTVHQPSSQLFALFDKVLLMTEGRVAFLGTAPDTLQFFKKLGFQCPAMFNPADFFIETLSIKNVKSKDTVMRICDSYDASTAGSDSNIISDPKDDVHKGRHLKKSRSPYKTTWLQQFVAVLRRSWISYVRDPMVLQMKLAQTVILALFNGCLFYQVDLENYEGIQNLNGAIFMLLCVATYQHLLATLDASLAFTLKSTIASVPSFLCFFVNMPMECIGLMFIFLQKCIECFLKTLLIMILVTAVCSGAGYIISCAASSLTVALILVPVAIFPFFLFGGLLLRPGSAPVFLAWIEYISWFFYGFEAMAIVQLENINEIKCNLSNGTCPGNGFAILESQGFNKDNFFYDSIILGVLAVGAQTIAFLVLLLRTFRQ